MWWSATILVVTVTVAVAVLGSAASLGVLTSAELFTSTVAGIDNACDTDGVTVTTNNDGTNITNVTVTDILDACIGNTLVVQIQSSGTVIAARSGAVPDGATNDNETVVVPDDNCDVASGNAVAVLGTDTRVLITNGTVTCGADLAVTISP